MLDRIDAWLLGKAESATQRYNKLTGNDNFSLAHLINDNLVIVAALAVIVTNLVSPSLLTLPNTVVDIVWISCSITWYVSRGRLINTVERRNSRNLAEIQTIEETVGLEYRRTLALAALFPFIGMYLLHLYFGIGSKLGILSYWIVQPLAEILVLYLISVSRPTQGRGLIREWLAGLLRKRVTV